MRIKNASSLVENGRTNDERIARGACIEALEAAFEAVDPFSLVISKVKIARNRLLVCNREAARLSRFERLVVIGGGKASVGMAEALERVLGKCISTGLVNAPYSQVMMQKLRTIEIQGASHPLPNDDGMRGVRRMLQLVGTPDRRTLVVCLLSGGGSALLPVPRNGLSLSDKSDATAMLLKAGATISELNVVRKHLSAIKGGWLARRLYPCAVVALVISDVIGERLDVVASGPLHPDPSTFFDAKSVLEKFGLFARLPGSVASVIREGVDGRIEETPKPGDRCFDAVKHFIVGDNMDACLGADRRLRELGYASNILTTSCEGEARDVGRSLGASLFRASGLGRFCAYVVGGETTVTVTGEGKGGRNQEVALGAAKEMGGKPGVAMAALGTDGVDGPTDSAGAIVDGFTAGRAKSLGMKVDEVLARNDSHAIFRGLGDHIITGPTGTNVGDIYVAITLPASRRSNRRPRP